MIIGGLLILTGTLMVTVYEDRLAEAFNGVIKKINKLKPRYKLYKKINEDY